MADNRRRRRIGTREVLLLSAVLFAAGAVCLLLGGPRILDVAGVGAVAAAWGLLVLLVVRRPAKPGPDLRGMQRSIVTTVVRAVEDTRAKQSRHEYHQERSLERIESELRRLSVMSAPTLLPTRGPGLDVLFVTSNGAGLGHISRLMAIAKRLPPSREVELLTLSTAYRQVAQPGMRIHHFPSSDSAGERPETWNPLFRRYFLGLVQEVRPRVVVFDGTWVYTGITDVCRTLGIPLVWVQRGMWRPEVDAASVQRHNARSVADTVIIPGDYAGTETVDGGDGIDTHYVGPIVLTQREDLLSREDACARLGLEPTKRYALLNLGGGSISDPDSLARTALDLLHEHLPELVPVQVVSPLAGPVEEIPGLLRVAAYPVMTSARAFEVMIAAAGYNSAQEAVSLGVPSLLVPNLSTQTDDQVRRAQSLAEKGLCLEAEGVREMREAMQRLSDVAVREELRNRLASVPAPEGARGAAVVLDSICVRAAWLDRVDTLDGGDTLDG